MRFTVLLHSDVSVTNMIMIIMIMTVKIITNILLTLMPEATTNMTT